MKSWFLFFKVKQIRKKNFNGQNNKNWRPGGTKNVSKLSSLLTQRPLAADGSGNAGVLQMSQKGGSGSHTISNLVSSGRISFVLLSLGKWTAEMLWSVELKINLKSAMEIFHKNNKNLHFVSHSRSKLSKFFSFEFWGGDI